MSLETAPSIAGVGSVRNAANESTAACLTQAARPATPPNVHKWRKSNYAVPGQRVVHPGMMDDFKGVDPTKVQFGRMVVSSDHVENVWRQPGCESEFQLAQHAQKEARYHSVQREPLGKSYSRPGHVLPERTRAPRFEFGKASQSSDSAKGLLYPRVEADEDEFRGQYVKSHGSYAPGEQRARAYNWRVDPVHHRFGVGVGSQVALNGLSLGVSGALRGEGDLEPQRVTSKKVEDFKNLQDQLGKVRNLGHGERAVGHDHTYGKASIRALHEWDARMCIQGDYDEADQAPDPDLGKSFTPGFRNTTNELRAFGTPSVRSDIPKYARRSVADNQNYGDDVNAQFLLYPGEFSSIGVEDDDLIQPRTKPELYEIFCAIGHELDGETFEDLYAEAASVDPRGEVSVHTLRNAMNARFMAADKAAHK